MNAKTIRIILYSYLAVIFIGALLLMLPFAHIGELSFIDALFTTTSATCVTGIVVKNTAQDFTLFGHIVLICLMQIGGVGYMTIVTFLFLVMRKNLNIHEKNMAKDSLNYSSNLGVQEFLKKVFLFTLVIELTGALILSVRFMFDMPSTQALWFGLFHSISAFNNAGFSLFRDNLVVYQTDFTVLVTVAFLIIFGGLGYLVLVESHAKLLNRRFMLSVHSKITIIMTLFLVISGTLIFMFLEWGNDPLFGEFGAADKILNSFFLSVNFRTSGFNSIDLSALSDATLFLSSIYMMIGGGAGSTAGGIKVTTIAVLIIAAIHTIKSSNRPPHIFKRTISQEIINRSAAIMFVATVVAIGSTLFLTVTEKSAFLPTLFEVTSAFNTVGVSVGNGDIVSLSEKFSNVGKSLIIVLMIMGRVGIFAFGFLIIGKEKIKHSQYPEGRILL